MVGAQAKIGNFVEIKKSKIGERTSIAHLSYVGDAEVGKDVNIGCGFVTCNFDGRVIEGERKHRTVIEDGVFLGSDCQAVAPVRIGRGAYVGVGLDDYRGRRSGCAGDRALSSGEQTGLRQETSLPSRRAARNVRDRRLHRQTTRRRDPSPGSQAAGIPRAMIPRASHSSPKTAKSKSVNPKASSRTSRNF